MKATDTQSRIEALSQAAVERGLNGEVMVYFFAPEGVASDDERGWRVWVTNHSHAVLLGEVEGEFQGEGKTLSGALDVVELAMKLTNKPKG